MHEASQHPVSTYTIPASPARKAQPEPCVLEDVAGGDRHQYVWQDVEEQVEPLQHPFQHNQLNIALLPVFPAEIDDVIWAVLIGCLFHLEQNSTTMSHNVRLVVAHASCSCKQI